MFSTNWDVNKYKNDYESEEHWNLRREFMEAHKNKYPEFRLVCLTQVFFNMEFLGCKYPEKTMMVVNQLAEEVAETFREARKGKLKRTFVGAQEAAGAKAQGAKPPPGKVEGNQRSEPEMKKPREQFTGAEQSRNLAELEETLRELAKTFVLVIPTRSNSKTEEDPVTIMRHNFTTTPFSFSFEGSKNEGGWTCSLKVDPCGVRGVVKSKDMITIASAFNETQRGGKYEASIQAIKNLKQYCSYLMPNPAWFAEGGTPEFIAKKIQCNKTPRTYLIMTKKDTGRITPEVADMLLTNFMKSSNEDMFFISGEYSEMEKTHLMSRTQFHKLGFRHFGPKVQLKDHHICVFKEKSGKELFEEARRNGWSHPKYLVHLKKD